MQRNISQKLVSVGLATMMAFNTAAVQAEGLDVPSMKSDFVRNAVVSALNSAKCWVVKKDSRLGVMGDERHKFGRGGVSCHNVGRAIDIFPDHIACDDPNLKGIEKLQKIVDKIPAWRSPLLTVCGPNGQGACIKPHNGHIHIGAKEALSCVTP